MFEALRGRVFPWTRQEEMEAPQLPAPMTPLESAKALIELASGPQYIDPNSPSWKAVQRWAANEILRAQGEIEVSRSEKLAARLATLRELLEIDKLDERTIKIESGPNPIP
jgi:hypothetical protein